LFVRSQIESKGSLEKILKKVEEEKSISTFCFQKNTPSMPRESGSK